MDNKKNTSEKKQKIKGYITVVLIVIVVIGAALQICSRHGINISKIFESKTVQEEKESEKKSKIKPTGFNGNGITDPYIMGRENEEFPDADFVKCSVDTEQSNGIKLSDIYYITDEENGIEQIRFRYAIDDTSSTINLLVRGMVTFSDEFGNNMFGLYNALTDNYGSYRSQVITVNLADSKYENARGLHFHLKLEVDTTKMGAVYTVSVPLKDGTVTPVKDFHSDGLKTPYIIGDNENAVTDNAVWMECQVEELSAKGIELSDVFYISDEQNQIEQIRFRYALSDREYDKVLSDKALLTLIDEDGNVVDGITVSEDAKFGMYPAQTVTIDLSESSYSGAYGKAFKVMISVEGTDYIAEYGINVTE